MEDVLDIYEMPRNPDHPLICMDEKPSQLPGEVRTPLPMRPSDTVKIDSEYVRNVTCSIFVFTAPMEGFRHVSVLEHRTALDWAEQIKYLCDVMFTEAEKIILVMDNLNTHKPASLCRRFHPEEARRLLRYLGIHYTPEHSIWLDIAEIE